MKKRVKKRHSAKRSKNIKGTYTNFFIVEPKHYFLAFLLALLILFNILIASAATVDVKGGIDQIGKQLVETIGGLGLGDDPITIIFSLIFLLIVWTMVWDIFALISVTEHTWISAIIASGATIAVILLGWPLQIATLLIYYAGFMGTIGVILEIGIGMFIFIGLIAGFNKVAKFAAKRKGQAEYIRSIKGASEAKAAVKGLRELEEEFAKK